MANRRLPTLTQVHAQAPAPNQAKAPPAEGPARTDRPARRVLVAGAAGSLGHRVVRALLEGGAQVTALVAPGDEERLHTLRGLIQLVEGDPWNPGSLRGRARGHAAVVHLVGGIRADPARGLTYRHLNFVSARNVTQMAVNDGVPHLILLSAAARPFGLPREYIESKRDAERHVQKSGLGWTILRASPMYAPGRRRNILYMALSLFRRLPLLGRLVAGYASTDVEIVAQGIASLALSSNAFTNRMIGPTQLHRLGRTAARQRRRARVLPAVEPAQVDSDEPPFGWLPPVR